MDQIAAAGLDKGFDHSLISSEQFGCAVVFAHNDQWADLLPHIAKEFHRYAICQWHKTNPMPVANKHYQPDTEIYVHAWCQGHHPAGELCQKQRFILAPNGQDGAIAHPTVKPLAVMRKIVANVTGQLICDPFMGSGSTGVAAVQDGRDFVGIEVNPRFFDLACKRIDEAQRQGSLFGAAA
jgi:site-specific DNA-methyltransferase (adenine-specific)